VRGLTTGAQMSQRGRAMPRIKRRFLKLILCLRVDVESLRNCRGRPFSSESSQPSPGTDWTNDSAGNRTCSYAELAVPS